MSDIIVLVIIMSICFGAGAGIIIYSMKHLDELYFAFAQIAAWVFIVMGLIIGVITFEQHDYKEQLQQAEEMLENGCKAYIDGREVDTSYIDLKRYEIVIKDENVLLYEK